MYPRVREQDVFADSSFTTDKCDGEALSIRGSTYVVHPVKAKSIERAFSAWETDVRAIKLERRVSPGDGFVVMKHIGFLSFGHWAPSPHSQTRSASDALLQSIDLAIAAEELGADGAYFRVHHFANQLSSPFPLLAAIGARTRRIEIGTAVIDMRYENPLYMAEDAGSADLISGGRLQLGISADHLNRSSRAIAILASIRRRYRSSRYGPRAHTGLPGGSKRRGFAEPNPRPMFETHQGCFESSRTRTVCVSGFGGALGPPDRRVDGATGNEPHEFDASE